MKHQRYYLTIGVLLITLLMGAIPSGAQEEEHPLLHMLGMIPQQYAGTPLAYQDFRAVEDARDYLEKPASYEAFIASQPNLNFTQRWLSAPDSVGRNFMQLAEMPTVMGFDFFDIDRTLQFGQPPAWGTIWQGNFDPARIAEAHTARGYVETEINGVTAWCPEAGCDQGMQTDVRNRELANIFDNGIGRKIPFLVRENYLLSSPALAVLEESAAISGDSLADLPEYRALAEAFLEPEGLLIGVQFLDSSVQLVIDPADLATLAAIYGGRLTPEEVQAQFEAEGLPEWADHYGSLPPYRLAAIADRQEGDQQVALIGLVYASAEEAEIAAPELASRISTFSDAITRSNATEPLLDNIRGAEVLTRVYTSESGTSVAIVEIRYDSPTEAEEITAPSLDNGGMPPALMFRYLVQAYMQRSLYPLWIIVE